MVFKNNIIDDLWWGLPWLKLRKGGISFKRSFKGVSREVRGVKKSARKLEELAKELEMEVGALYESFICNLLWNDLREGVLERGEEIVFRKRNVRVGMDDVDLLIVTDKRVYVVDVKVKPVREDVDELLKKTVIIMERYGDNEVVAILAGTWIDSEVEEYARSKGVEVRKY